MHSRLLGGRRTARAGFLSALGGCAVLGQVAVGAVTFDWATVGDPGNAPDTQVMNKPNGSQPGDGTSGYGSVDYTYRITKYDVTNDQYVAFLNKVDPIATNATLYITNMSSLTIGGLSYPAYAGGIDKNPSAAAGSRYTVKPGQGSYPVVHINWARAARFVNWLANGQGSGGTESGVYDMSVFATNSFAAPPPRAAGAEIFLPSENEWYKAAYYDPTKGGVGGYWQYGTRSDSAPTSVAPPGSPNSANIGAGTTGASGGAFAATLAKTGAAFDRDADYLTSVGSYTTSMSYYGLSDLDGVVFNWTEATRENRTVAGQMLPIYRGGFWQNNELNSGASFRNTGNGAGVNIGQFQNWGFRIAALPAAPSSDIVIDVASGTVTQSQAGYPSITTADSVTKTGSGTLIFDAVNSYAGPTTVSAGTLRVASNTGLPATAMSVDAGGMLALPQDARVSLGFASLAVADGGLVDLGAGQVTIAAGGISAADLRADIIAGRNGGGWNGTAGITSAAAAGSGGTRAVGYVVAGDGSARASFAAPGDGDLSGQVNVFDLLGIDSAGKFGTGQASVWSEGDFNYDGVTNIFDLLAIDTAGAYGAGNYFPSAPAVSGALGTAAAVPEPGATGLLLAAAASAMLGVWRRR